MSAELDWTDDEAVVRTVFTMATSRGQSFAGDGWRHWIEYAGMNSPSNYPTTGEAWKAARQHPTVQAYERFHNPKYQQASRLPAETPEAVARETPPAEGEVCDLQRLREIATADWCEIEEANWMAQELLRLRPTAAPVAPDHAEGFEEFWTMQHAEINEWLKSKDEGLQHFATMAKSWTAIGWLACSARRAEGGK